VIVIGVTSAQRDADHAGRHHRVGRLGDVKAEVVRGLPVEHHRRRRISGERSVHHCAQRLVNAAGQHVEIALQHPPQLSVVRKHERGLQLLTGRKPVSIVRRDADIGGIELVVELEDGGVECWHGFPLLKLETANAVTVL